MLLPKVPAIRYPNLLTADSYNHALRTIIYIDNFLAKHGYTPTTGETLVPFFLKEGLTVMHASTKKNKLLRLLHMLAVIYKHRLNALVLIATYSTGAFYFAYACSLLCRQLRVPYVPCLHGGNLPLRIQTSPQLCKKYFTYSDTNVAVSGYLQQVLLLKGWPCSVIPNGISINQYLFLQRTKAQPKLLWVRSFHKIYNPQMAIKVLCKLTETYPRATLTMIGPDKDGSLNECKALTKELHIEDRIVFTGKLSKEAWIAESVKHDVFINTSNADNLPVSVIEAMALGMIVISTNVGGVPYLINDGVNGLLVNINDAEAMFKCIEKVMADSHLAMLLSSQAREQAVQYDEQKIIRQWKNLLCSI